MLHLPGNPGFAEQTGGDFGGSPPGGSGSPAGGLQEKLFDGDVPADMLIESSENFPDPAAAMFLEKGVTTGGFMGDPGGGQVVGRFGAFGGGGEPFPVLRVHRSPQTFENLFAFRWREGPWLIHPMPFEYEFHRLVQEGNPFIGYLGPPDDLFPKVLGFPPAPAEPCFDKDPGFNQSGLDPLQTKDQITLHRVLPLFLGIRKETNPFSKE